MAADAFDKANKPQTKDSVLNRMALTYLYPRHKHAFLNSCHGVVARFLKDCNDKNSLDGEAKIILLGNSERIDHSIVILGDAVLKDSWSERQGYGFLPEEGMYKMGAAGALHVQETISMSDFFENHVSKAWMFKTVRTKSFDPL